MYSEIYFCIIFKFSHDAWFDILLPNAAVVIMKTVLDAYLWDAVSIDTSKVVLITDTVTIVTTPLTVLLCTFIQSCFKSKFRRLCNKAATTRGCGCQKKSRVP